MFGQPVKFLLVSACLLLESCQHGFCGVPMIVVKRKVDGSTNYICSGVLIKRTKVLTTCSCVCTTSVNLKNSENSVVVYEAKTLLVSTASDQKELDNPTAGILHEVNFVTTHPKCDSTYAYDAAVLHLKIPMESTVSVANIVSVDEGEKLVLSGKNCETSALGVSNSELAPTEQHSYPSIKVDFAEISKCHELTCLPDEDINCDTDLSTMACLEATDGTPICATDTGAPVFCNSKLVGITSLHRVIESNCDSDEMKTFSLVYPIFSDTDFITSAMSATKPKRPNVNWKANPGEPSMLNDPEMGLPKPANVQEEPKAVLPSPKHTNSATSHTVGLALRLFFFFL